MSTSLLRLFSRAHYWVNKYILKNNNLWVQKSSITHLQGSKVTLLSCLVVGQNSIVMSLKLCTFGVVNQCYVGRNHLL